ncbi:hypothetical protein [Streptomyces sp. SID3212]|uniref:hypothetical protein n=1 Tax=Streptomyces sp. SID3212 TaxID=2690259 RepID=UPI00136B1ED8|nr:hypothetical protein [Streptomyces sp. SID3212]MYV57698.1 hypothetical protein [Streptomyces sp. SID3212]
MSPCRAPGRLLPLLFSLALLTSCQGGVDDSKPAPGPVGTAWTRIPVNDLPTGFYGFDAKTVVASDDGFVVLGRNLGSDGALFRSADGAVWKAAGLRGDGVTVKALAGYGGSVVVAGLDFGGGDVAPVVVPYRGKGKWGRTEKLPGGVATDEVLAAASGPSGTVVVGHDGGEFDGLGDRPRGHSLRVWASVAGKPFGTPYRVGCPQWADRPPEAGALADRHGFTVWARCSDPQGVSAVLVLASEDGRVWRPKSGPRTGDPVSGAAFGADGSVVMTAADGRRRLAAPARSRSWSRDVEGATEWERGSQLAAGKGESVEPAQVMPVAGGYLAVGAVQDERRVAAAAWVSDDGVRWARAKGAARGGFAPAVRLTAAAEHHGTVVVFGTEPPGPSQVSGRTHVWLGRLPGGPAVRVPSRGSGLRAFQGLWDWAGASLEITPKGDFTFRYRLYNDCARDAPPCDDGTDWGGLATGTVREESADVLRGRVASANVRRDKNIRAGARVVVEREPYGAIGLTVGGFLSTLCVPESQDPRCADVHG